MKKEKKPTQEAATRVPPQPKKKPAKVKTKIQAGFWPNGMDDDGG